MTTFPFDYTSRFKLLSDVHHPQTTTNPDVDAIMSDQLQELIDIPRDFIKDGTMFINRCTKRRNTFLPGIRLHSP